MNVISLCDSFYSKTYISTWCERFYVRQLVNFMKPYNIMSKWYISWRKMTRYIFQLSSGTHNYIVSNLGNCITAGLDCRPCKYTHTLLHCANIIVQQIMEYKLLSPTSILADKYRYLCYTYTIAYIDWYRDISFILIKIMYSQVVNKTYICFLL